MHRSLEAGLAPQDTECEEELRTRHYGGDGAGHGVVRCREVLILAAFEEGRPRTTLDKKDFRPEKLKETNLSVARKEHTTRPTFDEHVIGDESAPKGRLLGVACVEARLLRALTFEMVGGQPPAIKTGRAICVIDRVERGDHDGHAALGFSEALEALTERQKSQWRTTTRTNLIDVFGSLRAIDEVLPCAAGTDDGGLANPAGQACPDVAATLPD